MLLLNSDHKWQTYRFWSRGAATLECTFFDRCDSKSNIQLRMPRRDVQVQWHRQEDWLPLLWKWTSAAQEQGDKSQYFKHLVGAWVCSAPTVSKHCFSSYTWTSLLFIDVFTCYSSQKTAGADLPEMKYTKDSYSHLLWVCFKSITSRISAPEVLQKSPLCNTLKWVPLTSPELTSESTFPSPSSRRT